jgi:hypothetical protein
MNIDLWSRRFCDIAFRCHDYERPEFLPNSTLPKAHLEPGITPEYTLLQ